MNPGPALCLRLTHFGCKGLHLGCLSSQRGKERTVVALDLHLTSERSSCVFKDIACQGNVAGLKASGCNGKDTCQVVPVTCLHSPQA